MKEEKIEKLIDKINHQIIEISTLSEPMNEASWGNQYGVIITGEEALEVVKILQKTSILEIKNECGLGYEIHGLKEAKTKFEKIEAMEKHMKLIDGLFNEAYSTLENKVAELKYR